MYIPPAFEITDEQEIFSFIEANAFGQLVSISSGELCSTHMPFLLSDAQIILLSRIGIHNNP
jgi:transcriptional regulator